MQACHNTTLAQACEHLLPVAPLTDTHTATDIAAPECPRTLKENLHLQAHLYSLSTPGDQDKMTFGSDAENICIDTGASACISMLRANFINLRPVTKLRINGIGTGLPIEGIGTLRWVLRDDKNRKVDLYIKDALYVPAAPMGLLCPQQIAQQTQYAGDGFNALSPHSILTFEGYTITVPYDVKCRLPILSTVDGVRAYTAVPDSRQPSPKTKGCS